MAENYNTYTEYDNTNVITIVSSASLSYDSVEADAGDEYLVFKDYGDGYFSSCTLQCDGQVTDITVGGNRQKSSIVILGLSYTDGQPSRTASLGYANRAWGTGGWVAEFYNPTNVGTNLDILLRDKNLDNTDTYAGPSVGTRYWFTAEHTVSDVTLYIYTDAARTVLVDTLAITVEDLPYSHLIGGGASVSGQDPLSFMSGNVRNLNIVAVDSYTPPTPDTSQCVNYTTFIENGTTGEYEVVSATQIQCTKVNRRLDDGYVIKSYGAGHFDAIKHQVMSECTAMEYIGGSAYPGLFTIWGISNINTQINDGMSGQGMALSWNYQDQRDLWVTLTAWGGTSDHWKNAVAGWKYYFTIERSSGSNITTCKVYKEADRTTLLDTMSVSCVTDAYRYVYAYSTYDYTGATTHFGLSGEIRYLELLELNAPDDPGEGGPTDYASNAEWGTSELNVTIPEGQGETTVNFYDDEDNLIGTATGEGGQTVSVNWNDLDCEEEYGWYVVMDNGESVATSPIWYFTCGSCDVFTIASESHPTIHLSPPRFRDGEQRTISKEINKFGFWSDNWATYDEGIGREPLTLIGWEWIEESGDLDIFHAKFTNIHDIMNQHEEIAISGLGDCLDGYYYIKNFHFRTIKGAPRIREWKLELEYSREKTW